MAKNVLQAPARAWAPVETSASSPQHAEWTDFSKEPKDGPGKKSSLKAGSSRSNKQQIRARKQTTMQIVATEIRLTSSGTDSGIAIDRIPGDLPKGPYCFPFVFAAKPAAAEKFFSRWTRRQVFPTANILISDVIHDGQWHELDLELEDYRNHQGTEIGCVQPERRCDD